MREKTLKIANAIRNRKGPNFNLLMPSEVADYIADCIEFVLDPYAALTRDPDEQPIENNTMEVSREMPKYRCHKEVHALKIRSITILGDGTKYEINPEDEGYGPFEIDADYVAKHDPQPGGYLVVYKDGYRSFSPAQAFEEGYTRI